MYNSLAINLQPRNSLEQIKLAILNFQQSAGTFSHLAKLLRDCNDQDDVLSPDLGIKTVNALEFISLAQAQECVWQTACMEKKRNGSISKVAIEVSRLYTQALEYMNAARHNSGRWIGFSFPSYWIKHVNLKAAHFAAVAQYRKSCDDLAANEYGIEAGRLQYAINLLKKPLQQISNPPTPAEKDSKGLLIKLNDTFQRSKRDNDLIYLQIVPNFEDLPEIKPISMVKSLIPNLITEEKIILEGILPYYLVRAMGVYEERKEDWIKNRINFKIEELDRKLVLDLQKFNLPGSLQALERPITLPPSLIRNSEELRNQQASKALQEMLKSVEKASSANLETLNQITRALDEEEKEDERLRSEYGTRVWTRPRSEEMTVELRDREKQLKRTLDAASGSDEVVRVLHREWAPAIELLIQDEDIIRQSIPPPNSTTLSPPSSSSSSTTINYPRKLRCLLDELEDLKIDRQRIIEATRRVSLKDQIKVNDFDSTKDFSLIGQDLEEIFDKRLDTWYSDLEKQVFICEEKQNSVLKEIEVVNQDFIESKIQDPLTISRQEKFQQLDLAYHKFFEIMNTLKEGLEFHHDFQKFIIQLKDQTDKFVQLRNFQAYEIQQNLGGMKSSKVEDEEEVKTDEKINKTSSSRKSSSGTVKKKKVQSISKIESKEKNTKGKEREIQVADDVDVVARQEKRRFQPGAYDPAIHGPIRFAE